jgi:hypothetical protein
MHRYYFYLAVAILAFSISVLAVFNFYWSNQQLIAETQKISEKIELDSYSSSPVKPIERSKYGCKEIELDALWEKLDKEAFLKFKRQEIKIRHTDSAFTIYPDAPDSLKRFEIEWGDFQREFSCTYFTGIDKDVGLTDLNSDGEKEIFVVGELSRYHGEKELFVFQNENNKLKLILFDIGNEETKIKNSTTNGYFDIETSTNISGGNKNISIFKFNGKNYEARNCLSENTVIKKGEETIVVNKPVKKRERCYQKFSKVLN